MEGPMSEIQNSIEDINRLILEIADGNFDYDIPRRGGNDELDAIIVGINMLREELKASTVSRDYLDSIYKAVVDMLFITDQEFNIVACNAVAMELLGVRREDIIKKPFAQIAPNFLLAKDNILKELDRENQVNNIELYFKDGNGTELPTATAISRLFDSRRNASGILIIAKDIREQKRSEEELKRAKDFAESSNMAKSRFLANMSHEIRTPLNGILGLTDILLSEQLSEAHRNYLDIIRTSSKNLTQLINDILDVSKIESGKLTLEKIPFTFVEVMSSNLHPYKFLAGQKGLQLSYHFDGAIPKMVLGDPTRISQITTNLISNAIKFTSAGSITIMFSLLALHRDEVTIQGIVKDTGIGVAKEKQGMIFQSFTQADDSVTRKFGGTGLGLSIVKSLLLEMGGDITMESPVDPIEGTGTSFIFSLKLGLPQQSAVAAPPPSPVPEKPVFNRTLKILVVDDNKINLLVAERMLVRFGAQVTTAVSGTSALTKIKLEEFDLVLMDIQMPEMDGYEATREMRRQNFKNPIVALSANAYSDQIQESLKSGMDGHLQKPFNEKQLFHTVSKFVQ